MRYVLGVPSVPSKSGWSHQGHPVNPLGQRGLSFGTKTRLDDLRSASDNQQAISKAGKCEQWTQAGRLIYSIIFPEPMMGPLYPPIIDHLASPATGFFPSSADLPHQYPLPLEPFSGDQQNHPELTFNGQSGRSPQRPIPHTPPPINYNPPWASHNPYTVTGTDLPGHRPPLRPMVYPLSPPHTGQSGPPASPMAPIGAQPPNIAAGRTRNGSHSSKGSSEGLKQSKRRNWSVTLDEGPNGEIRPTGFVADDGMIIQHGRHCSMPLADIRTRSTYPTCARLWPRILELIRTGGL